MQAMLPASATIHACPENTDHQRDYNKWDILRELTCARKRFDLSDRDLSVLQALLSFHPTPILDPTQSLIIYPSNRAICERLNGMANSTMRRHLKQLVDAGLLLRRDSPNGKRYARSFHGDKIAYGFDLSPLPARMAEICDAAKTERAAIEAYRRLREAVSLMRRDLAGIALYGSNLYPDMALWDQLSDLAALTARSLRRKLSVLELNTLEAQLTQALNTARDMLDPPEVTVQSLTSTQNSSTNAVQNEQHHQNSDKEYLDSERKTSEAQIITNVSPETKLEICKEIPNPAPDGTTDLKPQDVRIKDPKQPNLPLSMVLSCCTEIHAYSEGLIRHWHEFVKTADRLRPMMGVMPDVWKDAMHHMGPENAAIVLSAMLQRFEEIKNPGGYLRYLTQKAANNSFSAGPMIIALIRRQSSQL